MRIRLHNTLDTKDIRKRLRKEETHAEKALWSALRNRKLNGEKFTRQHGIGDYITDFYCSKYRLAIEVDGKIHLKKEVQERDMKRSEYITAWNIIIIRFTNDEVLQNIPMVLDEIKKRLVPTRPSLVLREGLG